MPTWPPTLPALHITEGFTERFGKHRIKTEMEEGEPKTRRLPNGRPDVIAINQFQRKDQVALFETFFKVTLAHGALKFDYTHPRSGLAQNYLFVEEPSIRGRSGNYYIVSFALEVT